MPGIFVVAFIVVVVIVAEGSEPWKTSGPFKCRGNGGQVRNFGKSLTIVTRAPDVDRIIAALTSIGEVNGSPKLYSCPLPR